MKFLLILTLVALIVAVSAGPRGRRQQRGRQLGGGSGHSTAPRARGRQLGGGSGHSTAPRRGGRTLAGGVTHRQRGRAFDPDIVASASENIAAIDDALSQIQAQQAELFGEIETMDPSTAQAASENLQSNIADAIQIAQENPQAQELQAEVVAAKVEDTQADLDFYLAEARKHQDALDQFGATMTEEEAVEHHKDLQKYLELSLHATQQAGISVQEEKAIEEGASPQEVAQIAPEITGRAMKQGRAWSAGCGIIKWC